ncbi:hypothetical protein BCR32DRAFT_287668 [Anaeromyces robustus]|uniref:CBM10 domain-containing protein n=1 Tax=Anaeromyces robustus TaxID=1754192 RepID=A0A1Y1VQM8_9FUNG|nr:hypothetical protein BCR32DRAFT_287668 [Anaeromyces robustus]|eukprot:ORX63570.1 hypothetical protein BCR32DRAFT_287668 [Anaeromyces robustus]
MGYENDAWCYDWCGIKDIECWAEKYGRPCCKNSMWGVENDEWCGITEEQCWAKKYGRPCCLNNLTEYVYADDEGMWGVENGDWCGFKCCKNPNATVINIDEDGTKWGIENDEWCGILEMKEMN